VKQQIFAVLAAAFVMGSAAVAQTAPAAAAQTPPASAPSSPPAASAPAHLPTKIGIIQVQQALLSTKDGQKAMAEFQAKFVEPRKKDLDRKATEIRELQDKLQRGGAAMADAAKAELTRNVDDKTKRYNRDMQDAQDEMQQENNKMLEEMSGKMMQVIDKYAQANGYAVIIDVSNPNTPVLYASNTVDITKEIIELYDKTVTSSGPSTNSAPKPTAPATSTPKPTTPVAPPAKKQPQ